MTSPADSLRARLGHRLIGPSDAGYDQARTVWNGAVDKHPALIAACATVEDVVAALQFARDHEMPVAVRGGGHGVAGRAVCDDGLVIDLRPIAKVVISASQRLARVGGGILNGEFDAATAQHGLATTAGIVSHTGLGGLTLGGGIGWLHRSCAATCDNLTGAQLVTADGTVVEAGDDPDLLWALRGAGANFGVVTRLDLRLHPIGPQVTAGVLAYHARDAARVLRLYRDLASAAPRELGTILNLRHAPPAPWLPPEVHGQAVILVGVCWTGAHERVGPLLAPLRALRPAADTVTVTAYAAHQRLFDAAVPHGLHYFWRSDYLAELDDTIIDLLVHRAWSMRNPRSYTIIFHLGGALADVDASHAAFRGRHAGYAININAAWAPPEPDDTAWVHTLWSGVHPYSVGVYLNFLDNEDQHRVAAAYDNDTFARLVELKCRYDPDNMFRSNHNIDPAFKEVPS